MTWLIYSLEYALDSDRKTRLKQQQKQQAGWTQQYLLSSGAIGDAPVIAGMQHLTAGGRRLAYFLFVLS
jgi:hypothetical protein